MKDVFDCLEESYNPLEEQIFLIKVVKNKKRKKIYYFKTIGQNDKIIWTPEKEESVCIFPVSLSYNTIKEAVRKSGASCKILRVPKNMKLEIIGDKPVRKEKWWDRFKVWLSRKVEEFCLPNESGDD